MNLRIIARCFTAATLLALSTASTAQAQYGGFGVYGPYGRPPPGAYDYPPGYIPPIERPRRPWGPQMEPCIYYGECRGNPRPKYDDRVPQGYPYPRY